MSRNTRLTHCSEPRNALCLLESTDPTQNPRGVCGRPVGTVADYSLITAWLSRCESLHSPYCRTEWNDCLYQIRLVDVKSRRIVRHPPGTAVEYLALSYMWGQSKSKAYQIGSRAGRLPQTLEDAIEVVRRLGKRYLWVDSLCIDQTNDSDKATQVKLMSAIYRGAFATVIALSGRTAYHGLPRSQARRKKTYPDFRIPQLACTIDGKCLGATMPTLKQQILASKWATRAWTYQEAILSPRCIYYTQHQVYFECNVDQRCESVVDSSSPIFSLTRTNLSPAAYEIPASVLGKGVFRNPFFGYSEYSIQQITVSVQSRSGIQDYKDYSNAEATSPKDFRGLLCYHQLLSRYTHRKMTNPSDALKAVSGLLQQLQEEYYYEAGFFWGLPCADLQYALLWRSEHSQTRPGFPSWSWSACEGQLIEAYPRSVQSESWVATRLIVCKAEKGELVTICDSGDVEGYLDEMDEFDKPWEFRVNDIDLLASWNLTSYLLEFRGESVELLGVLFIKGTVLHMSFHEIPEALPTRHYGRQNLVQVTPSNPDDNWSEYGWRPTQFSTQISNGIVWDNSWADPKTRDEINKKSNQMQDFLLVAREKINGCTRHHLILLEDHYAHGAKMKCRAGVMCLDLQSPKYQLRFFNPQHMWIPLA